MLRRFLKRLFIPNRANNYLPSALQKGAVIGMAVLIILTFFAASNQILLGLRTGWFSSAVLSAVLVDLTNDNRNEESLPLLKRNSLLDEAARMKAEDMAAKGYFAHTGPDGTTPWEWFDRVGYDYAYAGENLAVKFYDSSDVVNAWMASLGHRANILDGHYSDIGIGIAEGEYKGRQTVFVVQMFGALQAAPASETPSREIVSNTPVRTVLPSAQSDFGVLSATAEINPDRETLKVRDEIAVARTDIGASEASKIAVSNVVTNSSNTNESDKSYIRIWHRILSGPNTLFHVVYLLIAIYVAISLVFAIFIEWKRQHPVQLVYGLGLLFLMWGLLSVHTGVIRAVVL